MKNEKRKLPKGWRWEFLDNLFTIDKQQIDKSAPLFSKLSFIGLENIESNTRRFIPSENNEESGESTCYIFNDRHVLYGKLRPYLNKVYLPNELGRCSMEILPLSPKKDYSRSFIALVLQSKRVISYAIKHSTGIRMPRADINKLIKLQVPVPLSTNDRVVITNKLEQRMAEIEKMRLAVAKQQEAVEALPGAILREVFDFEEVQED